MQRGGWGLGGEDGEEGLPDVRDGRTAGIAALLPHLARAQHGKQPGLGPGGRVYRYDGGWQAQACRGCWGESESRLCPSPPQPEHLQILLSPSLVICPPGEKALMCLSQLLKFSKNKVIQVRSVFLVHKTAQSFAAQGGQSSSIAITCAFFVWGQRGCSRSHHHIRIPAGQGACMAIPLQGAISRSALEPHSHPVG